MAKAPRAKVTIKNFSIFVPPIALMVRGDPEIEGSLTTCGEA
jgi:hypothetical protein